jgi:hypothetical protein
MTTMSGRAVRGLSGVASADLQRELVRRRRVTERLETRRARLLRQLAGLEREILANGGGASSNGRTRPRNEQSLIEALAALLRGKSMSVTDAAGAVQKAGYKTNSNNFRTQVNIALIKGPFKRTGRGVYTAK